MTTPKKKKPAKEQLLFAPCSINQRILLTDNTTDIVITGGGKPCASTLKTLS